MDPARSTSPTNVDSEVATTTDMLPFSILRAKRVVDNMRVRRSNIIRKTAPTSRTDSLRENTVLKNQLHSGIPQRICFGNNLYNISQLNTNTSLSVKMFSSSLFRSSARGAARVGRRFQSSGSSSGGSGVATPLALVSLGGAAYVYLDSQSKVDEMAAKVDSLQVELSGKTNSAFVFIKPHACKGNPGSVEAVVEDSFKEKGIRVTDKGEISAEEIDQKLLIDTHYGAIASKAVKLKPSELNVPDKGKKQFEAAFGESWDSAVAAGKVYNAKDGAEKLGLDAAGVNDEWSKLTRGKNLIKFGGGFYCGKVKDIYVMNGFYMSMRAAYCNPGEKIKWYTVSWPTDSLSWEDFRGEVLGATDPTEAPKGSIRRVILEQYKKLGLATKPNTGDNGVHASASPFEALAERNNWLGKSVEEDSYGKGLIAAGVPLATISKWSGDCQVSVEGETKDGKTMSVFDTLEDLDADTILEKVSKISK